MITNLSQEKADCAVPPALSPPMVRFRMPFAIALAAVLCAAFGSAYAQDVQQEAKSVSSPDTSAAATPVASEQPQTVDVHDAQNPVASLISVPLQGNTYFNFGLYRRTANVLLIEPVIPFRLSENWNLIVRGIIPLISEPRVSPSQDAQFGLGNLEPQFYLSPAHPRGRAND